MADELTLGAKTTTTSPTSSASTSSSPSLSKSKIPTGAIAGGVVGAVAVIAVIAGVVLFYRRRKRQTMSPFHEEAPPQPPQDQHYSWLAQKAELDSHEASRPKPELPASYELSPEQVPLQELPDREHRVRDKNITHELHG